jgi:hypothetical protein
MTDGNATAKRPSGVFAELEAEGRSFHEVLRYTISWLSAEGIESVSNS